MPSMPNVRDSSGTIGTTWWPIVLSRISVDRIRTNAIVVEISRSPEPSSCDLNASSAGISSGGARRRARAAATRPARRGARAGRPSPASRRPACGTRASCDLLVGEVELEAVAERQQRVVVHLLLLVGDVLALAGLAHPVALDRLGEDHRRLARVLDGRRVGGVDLARVVAAAVEQPDLLVGHVRDALGAARGRRRRSARARRRRRATCRSGTRRRRPPPSGARAGRRGRRRAAGPSARPRSP